MTDSKAHPPIGNYEKLSDEKHLYFKGKSISYNKSFFLTSGVIKKFENVSVVSGNYIYIQSPENIIYSTEDLRKFITIGSGEIIGIINSALIYRNCDEFFIIDNDVAIKLFFYIIDDKLLYSHMPIRLSQYIINHSLVYNDLFVIASCNNVLFLSYNTNNDIQFRFPGTIKSMKIVIIEKYQFLSVNYETKKGVFTALFYDNYFLTSKVVLRKIKNSLNRFVAFVNIQCPVSDNPETELIYDISKVNFESKANNSFEFGKQDKTVIFYESKKSLNELVHYNKENTTDSCFHQIVDIETDNILLSKSNITSCDITNKKTIQIKIDKIQRKSLELACIEDRAKFMKNLFTGIHNDIVKIVALPLIHKYENIQQLIKNNITSFQDLKEMISSYSRYVTTLEGTIFSFFYEPASSCFNNKKLIFKFKEPFTKKEIEFLERIYTRVFHYNPTILKSKNLAYKIIEFENKNKRILNDKVTGHGFYTDKFIHYNKSLLKLLKFHYTDPRFSDMADILLENKIQIPIDINDTQSHRVTAFTVRAFSNIGSMLFNCKKRYYHSIHNEPIKQNSHDLEDKITNELIFFNTACIALSYKKFISSNSYALMGQTFGEGLVKELPDDEIHGYLKLIKKSDDPKLKFYLLIISTKSHDLPYMKSTDFNFTLKSIFNESSLDLKKAVICALAIYNNDKNDLGIIDFLKIELFSVGSVSNERNSPCFDRNYRTLISLAMATIANKPYHVTSMDSFANLLVLGLSSIGRRINFNLLYRTEDCRQDERFYSFLFTLTNYFDAHPFDIMAKIDVNELKMDIDLIRTAAELFYVGLYVLREQDNQSEAIYSKLFTILLQLEKKIETDDAFLMVYNYALYSCSIIKSGTGDFILLKMLRTEILKTKSLKFMTNLYFYNENPRKNDFEIKVSKEHVQMYKMCVGIVCADFGLCKLDSNSVKQVIISFFLTNEIYLDFNYIDLLRCMIIKCLNIDHVAVKRLEESAFRLDLIEQRGKCMKYFRKRFEKLSEIDQKFVVDILSDFYENYNTKTTDETLFDMNTLAKLVSIAK